MLEDLIKICATPVTISNSIGRCEFIFEEMLINRIRESLNLSVFRTMHLNNMKQYIRMQKKKQNRNKRRKSET